MTTAISRRRLMCAACALPLTTLIACSRNEAAAVAAQEFDDSTSCALDGMLLAEYAGPKAQVHHAGVAAPVFLCDTVELFAMLLRPEQVREVRAVFVQDMGKADWDKPRGHWFDARSGIYVVGSRRHGSMGPTIASFAVEADAQKFAAQWGGKVLRFADVRPEMADLSGGSRHDARM